MVSIFTGTIIYIIIGYVHIGDEFPNPFWPFVLGSLLGGLFPDMDRLIGGIRIHRNVISHSGIIQTGITISYLFTPDYSGFIFFLVFFFIGTGTHLSIDMIYESCPKEYKEAGVYHRWAYRLERLRQGKSPGHIVGPPFKIRSNRQQLWLLSNAVLLFTLAVILYFKLLLGIDLGLYL